MFLLSRRRYTLSGALAAGLTVFSGLFLLETAVMLRLCGLLPFYPGVGFRFELNWRIGWATLSGFGLSLCIEFLQLMFRLGFFELTDLVLNTVGTFLGAGLVVGVGAALVRAAL